MRNYLVFLLLFTLSKTAFAQTNPARDEKAASEKDRAFYESNKVKEVDEYLLKTENDALSDSTLFCRLFYDRKGNLVKCVQYSGFAAASSIPYNVNTTNYQYNNGLLMQKSSSLESYFTINGKMTQGNNKGLFNQIANYEYDKKGNLTSEDHQSNMMLNNKRLGFKAVYEYDKLEDRIVQKNFNIDGVMNRITEFSYNEKNELITVTLYQNDEQQTVCHPNQYTYNQTDSGFVKIEKVNNMRDSLIKQNEYVYDKNGHQAAGYQIVKGAKRSVLNFKYNDEGKPIESRGGPIDMKENIDKDVRHDGLAHLFYDYDSKGLLTEIKKYEMDQTTRKEVLTAVEKLVYKKY